MIRKIQILFLFLISCSLFSQDTIVSDLEQKIENIAENLDNEDIDYTVLVENLAYYKQHPINLNNTTKQDLEELQLLSEIQINNLLKHIEENGKLITIYELQTIDGFDIATIQKIIPFVKVDDSFSSAHYTLQEMFKYGNHQIILRTQQILEQQKGFTEPEPNSSSNSRYLGSQQKIFARYRFTYGNNVSLGITSEKDAGEEFFKGTQKNGFDFYSAHFFLRNKKNLKAFAIGDYQVMFGQGLAIWSGIAYNKSSDVMNIVRTGQGIRPYTSVDENNFMRGAAISGGFKKIEASVFVSKNRIDANITDTLNDGEILAVSSFQESGLHAISSEIYDKDAIERTVVGGNVSYKSRQLSLGFTAINTELSVPLNRSLGLYNQYEFSSKSLSNYSFNYNFLLKNFNFFGEAAMSNNGGIAYLNGLLLNMDNRLSFALMHRNFQKEYQSLFANAFSENTKPANEKGLYMAMSAKLSQSISLNTYFDKFEFPWLKYLVDAPSNGNDFFVQLNYVPSKKIDMYARYRQRDKFANTSEDLEGIDFIVPVKQSNYRFHISYAISNTIRLKNRIEYLEFEQENKKENGFMIYQDVVYKPMKFPISVTLRYALFETNSYTSRVYAYENDMPSTYSIPAYYYKGARYYVLLNYNLSRNIEFWVRYSQTSYSNRNIISEGSLNEIQGNTKSEVKLQMRVRF